MKFKVAVPTPLNQTFTYSSERELAPGMRVMVPFGPRRAIGVILEVDEGVGSEAFKIKPITSVLDEEPAYSIHMLELAKWMSLYYMHPIGEVLRTMMPASVKKSKKSVWYITDLGSQVATDDKDFHGPWIQKIFGKKKSYSDTVLKKKILKLNEENEDFPSNILEHLQKRYLVEKKDEGLMNVRIDKKKLTEESGQVEVGKAPILTSLQSSRIQFIKEHGFAKVKDEYVKPFLLHGVTGSGKTEVYLNLIQSMLEDSAIDFMGQSLVLVPEISLTPQMTMVFEQRFPEKVAVVHSAMSDKDRWEQLNRIRKGEALVLIGPRSAVFAPFKNLKLILVDEEHDQSYKQTTGLCYHGRDVAIVRAKMEKAVIVLGSATPALESYWNAYTQKYYLLEMLERVSGRALPEVKVIASKPASSKGTYIDRMNQLEEEEHHIDREILQSLKSNAEQGQQAILLVNRRGYAFYLFDLNEKKAFLCPNCSISMTLHQRSSVLHCHYCDHHMNIAQVKALCPEANFVAVGYGSQKAEESLKQSLPDLNIVRIDSDVVVQRDMLGKILGDFRAGNIDILVGTQILAKGHDFPKVTLIVILDIDQSLNLPDLRAGEKTFQLLVQAAGRAGRGEKEGKVIVQCSKTDHPILIAGFAQDYHAFIRDELEFRKVHQYPPFGRLILIELTSEDLTKLVKLCDSMESWLDSCYEQHKKDLKSVKVLGPAIPSIETIRKRHRRTILFSSSNQKPMRIFVQMFLSTFEKLPNGIRMKVDVDPQSLI